LHSHLHQLQHLALWQSTNNNMSSAAGAANLKRQKPDSSNDDSPSKKQKLEAKEDQTPAPLPDAFRRMGPVTRALVTNPAKMVHQIMRLKRHAYKLLPVTITYIFNRAKHAVVARKRAPEAVMQKLVNMMRDELSSNPDTADCWKAMEPYITGNEHLGECCCALPSSAAAWRMPGSLQQYWLTLAAVVLHPLCGVCILCAMQTPVCRGNACSACTPAWAAVKPPSPAVPCSSWLPCSTSTTLLCARGPL
jgi:hypothetical protein